MQLFQLRLYVAGQSPNSLRALANLKAICQEHLGGRVNIEVVDVLSEPHRALGDHVLVTPLLVKVAPAPKAEILGNLSDTDSVLRVLGIKR